MGQAQGTALRILIARWGRQPLHMCIDQFFCIAHILLERSRV
jgi:hypothetical protein